MNDTPLYSTATGSNKKGGKKGKKTYEKGEGPAKVRLEKKGRAGKTVTVIFNLPFEEKEAKRLMKDLQSQLGVGATFKDSRIELRGDLCDKAISFFQQSGHKLMRAGG